MNAKLKLFALLTAMAGLGCANGSPSSKDDPPPGPPPVLEMVQPASTADYLEVDRPVVLRFNEPLATDGYQLRVDGSPPIDRSTHLYTVDDQYTDVDEVILDDRGLPIEFRYGSLTFTPLCGRWRHDAAYELTVNFRNDSPPPVVYTFRTPPAPPDPSLLGLKGKQYAVGKLFPTGPVYIFDPGPDAGYPWIVHEIDSESVVFATPKSRDPDEESFTLRPEAAFKSGGVFSSTQLLTRQEASDRRLPIGATTHFQGEISTNSLHFAISWAEFDCAGADDHTVRECQGGQSHSSRLLAIYLAWEPGPTKCEF